MIILSWKRSSKSDILRQFLIILRSIISDDDEEEETEAAEPTEASEHPVKPDPEGEPSSKRKRERSPSYELHTYSAEELATFKKRELIADAELLDGEYLAPYESLL